MATVTQDDIATTGTWADVLVTLTGAANVSALYANVSQETVSIVFGGASPGASKTGTPLRPGDSFTATAANAWARGPGGKLSVTVL